MQKPLSFQSKLKLIIVPPYKIFNSIFRINILDIIKRIRGLWCYLLDGFHYNRLSSDRNSFSISLRNLYPCLDDRYDNAGSTKGDYFHQDLWVARKIFTANPNEHWDIGSRIDGFITHLLTFRAVNIIDIRPLESTVSGLFYHKGNITNLSHLDDSVESLSCLHTMEHIGLGRYGDPIDPLGYLKGMNELQRVLKPGGKLYFSVPIGQERVEFNAHRVFNPMTILKTFSSLNLVEFVAVNAAGDLMSSVQPEDFKDVRYACGIFIFQKSSSNEASL